MNNTLIATLNSNLAKGLYSTDTVFITKQVKKNESFFNQFAPMLATVEQLSNMKQKGVKRFTQAVNFALNGNVSDFDVVTAYMVSAVILTKANNVSFKDAHFLCGLNKDDSQNIRGVSRSKLNRFLGNAGTAGTITSKVSRTTGKGGFFTALNITNKSDKHSFTLTDSAKTNPLLLAYAKQLENMTDGQFSLIQAKLDKS